MYHSGHSFVSRDLDAYKAGWNTMASQRDLAIQDKDAVLQRMNSVEKDQALIDRMSAELQQLQGLAQVRHSP